MKYLVFVFWIFFSFQGVPYTKEKAWVIHSFDDLKDKKIIPSGFFDGNQEYKIRPNDLWLFFEDQNSIKVKLPNGVVELKTKGLIHANKFYYFQFDEYKGGVSTGKEGLLKLFNKKGAVTRIHLEYRGGGGYQFFLEK
jgi:hypothetical protein